MCYMYGLLNTFQKINDFVIYSDATYLQQKSLTY